MNEKKRMRKITNGIEDGTKEKSLTKKNEQSLTNESE